jgi:ribose transport system substrate-binding protein
MKKLLLQFLALVCVAAPMVHSSGYAAEKKKIALIPGLTTDAFYITMRKGAQAAAAALGAELIFQGAPEFNPVLQVPVLDAIISRKPDAILIAPTDKAQLIEPLKKANAAGIPVITVDTFIDDGAYQDGTGSGDFPLSYIASDNVAGGRIAARALAGAIGEKGSVYVSNVKPGISTTDQRELGFKEETSRISISPTPKSSFTRSDCRYSTHNRVRRVQGIAGFGGGPRLAFPGYPAGRL